jgi:hypothetical protein
VKFATLEDLLEAFLEEPTCDGFLRVREHLLADEHFAPHARVIDKLEQLVAQGRAKAALKTVDELMPAWGLCSRVHFLAGQAAEMLGDAEEVELCRFLVSTCVEGMLSTGRGTRRSPYLATYPSDVQDVLTAKGLTASTQRLIDTATTRLAGVVTHEGSTVWFDVGEMLVAAAKSPPIAVKRRRAAAHG